MTDFEGGGFRDIGSKLRGEFCHVVGEERGLVAGSGDRDVAEAGVEQIRVDACIGVYKDALRGEALGAVAGDGVAVVEMAMISGIEFDLAIVVEASGNPAIGRNRLDYGKVAIGDAERFVGRGELDAVTNGKLAVDLAIDADAGKAARIIGGLVRRIRFLDREEVCGGVDADDCSVGSSLDSDALLPRA